MTRTRKVCNSKEGRPPPAKRRRSAVLPLKEHNHQLTDLAHLGVKVISVIEGSDTADEDIENLRTSVEDPGDPCEKSCGPLLRLSGEKRKHLSTNCYSPTLDGSFRICYAGDEPSFFEPLPTKEENHFNRLSKLLAEFSIGCLSTHCQGQLRFAADSAG